MSLSIQSLYRAFALAQSLGHRWAHELQALADEAREAAREADPYHGCDGRALAAPGAALAPLLGAEDWSDVAERLKALYDDSSSFGEAWINPGIDAPWFDALDPTITEHTTGTGRLSWAVEADGLTRISVERPDPESGSCSGGGITVLSAVVWADGHIDADTSSVGITVWGRHWMAFVEALRAVLDADSELALAEGLPEGYGGSGGV